MRVGAGGWEDWGCEDFGLAGGGDADVEQADLAAVARGGLEEVRGLQRAEG
ncbi:hypothetical protein QP178_18720 [Sphingomonas aurantiaca]|uniref:hypothetical protein n=1 Tax=Sphingomonas aurantiaca TaxID=185949 RepID=UPI002FE090AD